jgi:secreted PhoX family phosphatase
MHIPNITRALLATAVLATAASAQFAPFTPPTWDTTIAVPTVIIPATPVQHTVLLRGAVDTATNTVGQKSLAKDWNDFTGYIPINGRSDSGYVIVNNEQNVRDSVHGNGGGMTVFTAQLKSNMWSVANHPNGKFRSVNFGPVGGTIANCGGLQTPWGTVLTAEEWNQASNAAIYNGGNGFTDTSDIVVTQFNGSPINKTLKRYQNLNWMVEVNPATAQVVRKHYNMGRFEHEGGIMMPDNKTVYLTDDFTPGVFFKFVSDSTTSFTKGQLYAYQQSVDGLTGSWITLPMDIDSMMQVRNVAMRRGATMFTRLEWAETVDGKVYIAETGADNSSAHKNAAVTNGVSYNNVAKHLRDRRNSDSSITDYYGRVLRFDPATNKMDVLLEGGTAGGQNLASPDGLTAVTLDGKKYLVIQEDLIGRTQGRSHPSRTMCEMFWLDLSIANPTVADLKRMVVGTNEAEITGARFTPDGKTMFVNIQHPSTSATAPYNTSYTMAVWGYTGQTVDLIGKPRFNGKTGRIEIEVNPLSRFAYFNQAVNVELFDTTGKRLERHKNVRQIDVAHLNAGHYYVRLNGTELHKLILQ